VQKKKKNVLQTSRVGVRCSTEADNLHFSRGGRIFLASTTFLSKSYQRVYGTGIYQ